MNNAEFSEAFGETVEIEDKKWGKYDAFVPLKLPPKIDFDQKLVLSLTKAESTLSKLSGVGLVLPNPDLLIIPYMKKEALSSSRIEGTRISLSDFLLSEAIEGGEDGGEAFEVINHIKAINFGLERIKEGPITLELIEKMHAILLEDVRGSEKTPGKYRNVQNWLGPPGSRPHDASFVPPPSDEVTRLMKELIEYVNTYDEMPLLIKCALMHYQFETIHPFCDGNGRMGRALITLYLCNKNKLSKPLLYISSFFEKYKPQYSQFLLEANKKGNFRNWLLFFLDAIKTQSEDALSRSIKMQNLRERYRNTIQKKAYSASALAAIDGLFSNPFTQITKIAKQTKTTYPTAKRIAEILEREGIIKLWKDSKRKKTYVAHEILDIITI